MHVLRTQLEIKKLEVVTRVNKVHTYLYVYTHSSCPEQLYVIYKQYICISYPPKTLNTQTLNLLELGFCDDSRVTLPVFILYQVVDGFPKLEDSQFTKPPTFHPSQMKITWGVLADS